MILTNRFVKQCSLILLMTLVLVGYNNCSQKSLDTTNTGQPSSPANNPASPTNPAAPAAIPKGTRIIGMDILNTTPSSDFTNNIALAKGVGVESLALHIAWNLVESGGANNCNPGTYTDPYGGALATFNSILPANSLKLSLTVNPLTTNIWTLPSLYSSSDFTADPNLAPTQAKIDQMVCRFNNMLDWIFTRIPNIQIVGLQIGNELEHAAEASNPYFWSNYWRFYSQVALHARTIRTTTVTSAMKVGVTATWQGLTGVVGNTQKVGLKTLNDTISDIITLTYYPSTDFSVKDPSVPKSDFDQLMAIYTDSSKKVYVQEAGYQTGNVSNGSSATKQAQFISNFFEMWDFYLDRIAFVSFLRLNDLSHTDAQNLANSYTTPTAAGTNFVEFLETLGLRNYDGTAKAGYTALESATKSRGW